MYMIFLPVEFRLLLYIQGSWLRNRYSFFQGFFYRYINRKRL